MAGRYFKGAKEGLLLATFLETKDQARIEKSLRERNKKNVYGRNKRNSRFSQLFEMDGEDAQ